MQSGEDFTKAVHAAAKLIAPMLLKHPPAEQGAILAELLGFWLACHPADKRERLWESNRRLTRAVMEKLAELLDDEGMEDK